MRIYGLEYIRLPVLVGLTAEFIWYAIKFDKMYKIYLVIEVQSSMIARSIVNPIDIKRGILLPLQIIRKPGGRNL